MIGRAAQGNPWLPGAVAAYLRSGVRVGPPSLQERADVLLEHLHTLHAFYGEASGVRIARKHLSWSCKAYPHGERFWRNVNRVECARRQNRPDARIFPPLARRSRRCTGKARRVSTSRPSQESRAAATSLGGDGKGGSELLRDCVKQAAEHYFRRPDGTGASGLFKLVMAEVEPPLCEAVLAHAGGNQSRAAHMLGINRGTLRNKMGRNEPRRYTLICGTKLLRDSVTEAVEDYFRYLGGHDASGLFDLVMGEVEPPLLESALAYAGGNRVRAAGILGHQQCDVAQQIGALRPEGPRRHAVWCERHDRPRAYQRVGQDRDRRVRPRPARARYRDPLHRRHRGASRRRGRAGGRDRLVHRVPGDDGWPRQDAAPEGPRRSSRAPRHRCRTMREHGIKGIDLLVVNLYPFERTVADPDCDLAAAIENIDVGGPAMLRAAAKNHAWVAAVVDAGDYAVVLDELRATGKVAPATRFRLAAKAFEHTARYDGAIASYSERGPARIRRLPRSPHLESPVREVAGDALRREPAPACCVLHRAGRRGGGRRDGEAAPGQGALVQQRGRHRCRA